MAFAPTSPVTGAAQTGLTTPTYTLSVDTAPDSNGKQYAVTALGGTQTGAIAHSVAAPFTTTFFRPKVLKTLSPVDPVTGVLKAVPRNTYKLISRKGVLPLAGQAYQTMQVWTVIEVPAGADTVDAANVRAALSCHIGLLNQVSAGIGDTALNGVM